MPLDLGPSKNFGKNKSKDNKKDKKGSSKQSKFAEALKAIRSKSK